MKFRGTERFRLTRHLGSGSFGTVYEAEDHQLGRPVALKLLDRVDPDSLIRFKREFRSLSDFRHRNVVALNELLSDGAHWFYTMELVRGSELLEYLARQEILRALEADLTITPVRHTLTEAYVRDVRLALLQLVDALSAIHSAGKLHRDVKPTNVLVTDDGRVVLLDFGLVREIKRRDGDETTSLVGTPGYMSPEQVDGRRLDEASDWYSFGVVLYQALTGSLPFTGSFFEIAVAQKSGPARPASELVGGIGAELNELCSRLLQRQSDVRPTAQEIRATLTPAEMTYWLPPFRSRRLGHDRSFVGRRQYLDLLSMFFRQSLAGETKAVFLHGASGVGKTALVNAFLDQVRASSDAFILATRCYERELVPYRGVDGVVDSIARIFSNFALPIGDFTAPEVSIACEVFPILRQIDRFCSPGSDRATLPAQSPHSALAKFFHDSLTLFASVRPTVVFIDDAQWGDLDSGQLLNALVKNPAPPVMFILSYTTEDFATSLLLQTFRPEQGGPRFMVELQPLDRDEARDVVRSAIGRRQVTRELVESILNEANGNAFFLEELISHVIESEQRSGPVSLSSILNKRFDSLSEGARALVSLVAAAGAPVNADWARSILGIEKYGGDEFLTLRAQRWIRSRFTGELEEVEIYHSRLREFVVHFKSASQNRSSRSPEPRA